HTEPLEIVGGNVHPINAFRLSTPRERESRSVESCNPFTNLTVLPPGKERLDLHPGFSLKHHEPIRFLVRQRVKQSGVHDAEEGRVRAKAERQRDDGNQREAGVLEQHSRAIAQVLPERFYPSPAANVIAEFSVPAPVAETFQRGGPRLV